MTLGFIYCMEPLTTKRSHFTMKAEYNQCNTIKRKIVRKEKVGCGTGIHWLFHVSLLPQKFCPWRAQLQNAANQTLALIQRGRGSGEVELTVIQ